MNTVRTPALRRPLGPKHWDCLRLAGTGMLTKEIAILVGLAEGTVKGYLNDAYQALGIARQYNRRVLLARYVWEKEFRAQVNA